MGRSLLITVVLTLCLSVVGLAADDTISQIRIQELTKTQFLEMTKLGLDVIDRVGDEFDVLVTQVEMGKLDDLGIHYEITRPDIVAFYKTRFGKPLLTMGGFRTLSEIESYLDSLHSEYGSICTEKFSIGKSHQNRDLWVVKISDNPDMDEDEPEVFYNSLIHAREPAGAASVLHFMKYLYSVKLR